VATNIGKHPLFSIEERLEIVRREFEGESRVEVATFDGLLVDYAESVGATVLLRGLRAVSDFEYELQMANMNRSLSSEVETLFMMSEDHQSYISSHLIKEVAGLGGSVANQVPGHVNELLVNKFATARKGQ
jgi:pantetheine-phosphate adenylyltransferase